MKIIRTCREMQAIARTYRTEGHRIALVPTMGYLHDAHLSLVRLAREQAERVEVSLFVNPNQFGPGEDFDRYPRDQGRDERLCREAGVDVLFCPEVEQMYTTDHAIYIEEPPVARILEGLHRPGHFKGVLTIVAKLFNASLPDVAVFGAKDAQQLYLIQRMVTDLNFPVRVVAGPTVREPDGLAMSSRNAYLNSEERQEATCLHAALLEAQQHFAGGEGSGDALRHVMRERIARERGAVLDYAEVVDLDSFLPVDEANANSLAVLAVRIGGTRLIDNMPLEPGNGSRLST